MNCVKRGRTAARKFLQTESCSSGDVPKRLKGLHSKCSRGVKARESSNLSISANPLKSSVSAGSFCFYTDCSLPHRNMGGYFLWPIVRILYSIFECYGAEMVPDTSAMPYINQHKRVPLGRQNEKDIPHSTARMSLYLCFII